VIPQTSEEISPALGLHRSVSECIRHRALTARDGEQRRHIHAAPQVVR
jgi:hypothetical protein